MTKKQPRRRTSRRSCLQDELRIAQRADFRRYNAHRPNRTVPYRLPAGLAAGLRALLDELRMETASVDFIRTPGGRHVFLEVNPAGQFGMMSHPCNYRLEKRVASYLIERSRDVDR